MRVQVRRLFMFFGVLVLSACGEAPFYEKAYSFENREWKQDVKLKYEVDFQNIEKEYDFTLSLRTSTDYKYNNIWVFMKTETPDGTTAREPFELKITNPDGSWIGEKSGSIVTTSLYFKRRKMPVKGKYTFTLEQGITDSKIDEGHDLTLFIEEAKPPNEN